MFSRMIPGLLAFTILFIPAAMGETREELRSELQQVNSAVRQLASDGVTDPKAYEEYMKTLARLEQQAHLMGPRFLENILILTANTYQRTGRPREAIRDYQRMVDTFPDSRFTEQRKNKIRNLSARLEPAEELDREVKPELPAVAVGQAEPENPYEKNPGEALRTIMAEVMELVREDDKEPAAFEPFLTRLEDLYQRTNPAEAEDRAAILGARVNILLNATKDLDRTKAELERILEECEGTQAADNAMAFLEKVQLKKALEGGGIFPDFSFTGLNGETVSLLDYRGKVVLIDFWATWCPPCIQELPNVKSTYSKYHKDGFEIIGISLDTDRAKLEAFLEKEKMEWVQYFDGRGWRNELSSRFGIRSIPATYLLGPDGKVIASDLRGSSLKSAVRKALKEL